MASNLFKFTPMSPDPSSPSKVVLVTGCSSGIGHATAARLAERGWTVYATARKREAIADLEAAGCRTLALDVTDETSMDAAVAAVEAEHGAVGVLVNNAGYSQSGAIESVGIDDVRRQFETNVFGLVRLTQLVLPGMRAQGLGKVVNVSSMGANFTFPGGGFYHATKYAVEAHQRRAAVRGEGVRDRRRRHPAGHHQDRVRRRGGRVDGRGRRRTTARTTRSTPRSPRRRTTSTRRGRWPSSAAGRRTSRRRSSARSRARRPKIRYRVTPSAHMLVTQRALMTDGMWDAFLRTQFDQPGKD